MKRKVKRKISIQKLFNFASFIFLLICVIWYGGRTIYYYLDSKKTTSENKLLSDQILKNNLNNKNFKKLGKNYYFYKDATNNYVTYANILWRIIKINNKNETVLISEQPITSLSYGESNSYTESSPIKWMNSDESDDYTGILENNITNTNDYLAKTKTCIDNITDTKDIKCKKTNNDNYFSLLDINDYINTGYNESFINNNYYIYLANKSDDEVWYINAEGELNTDDGTEIIGIKPTITLKNSINYLKGTGTEKDPYIIEEKNQYFASYVKLDKDIYRVYNIQDNTLKLSLNDYLKVNGSNYEHIYSNNNYYHNDTKAYTLANYLNTTYYNSLNYKNIILHNKYINYYYGMNNNYNYKDILNNKIDTNIYTLSIADPILNNLDNYFIATGTNKNSSLIYIKEKDGTVTEKAVTTKKYIIPCISIDKSKLTKGSGTLDDPYRME